MNDTIDYFSYSHLPANLQGISRQFGEVAYYVFGHLPAVPQREVALQKLLEAKDAAVRAQLDRGRNQPPMLLQTVIAGLAECDEPVDIGTVCALCDLPLTAEAIYLVTGCLRVVAVPSWEEGLDERELEWRWTLKPEYTPHSDDEPGVEQ